MHVGNLYLKRAIVSRAGFFVARLCCTRASTSKTSASIPNVSSLVRSHIKYTTTAQLPSSNYSPYFQESELHTLRWLSESIEDFIKFYVIIYRPKYQKYCLQGSPQRPKYSSSDMISYWRKTASACEMSVKCLQPIKFSFNPYNKSMICWKKSYYMQNPNVQIWPCHCSNLIRLEFWVLLWYTNMVAAFPSQGGGVKYSSALEGLNSNPGLPAVGR